MSDIKFCPECGEKVSANDAYCGMCGTALPRPGAAESPPPEAPVSEETADEGESFRSIVLAIGGFIIILILIAKIPSWFGLHDEPKQEKPKSITFNEWANQDSFQPEIPKKKGFSDLNKESSDAEAPKSFEQALANIVMQQADQSDKQTGKAVQSRKKPIAASRESTNAAGSRTRVPYIVPGEQAFVTGILQTNCQSGVNDISFELGIDSDGTATGNLLSDGWFYAPLRGTLMPSGKLKVTGQLYHGGTIEISGQVKKKDYSDFLKGGGRFQLIGRGPRGNVECKDNWATKDTQ